VPSMTIEVPGIPRTYSPLFCSREGILGPPYSAMNCPGRKGTRAKRPMPHSPLGEAKQNSSTGPYALAVSKAAIPRATSFSLSLSETSVGSGRVDAGVGARRCAKSHTPASQKKKPREYVAGLPQLHSGANAGTSWGMTITRSDDRARGALAAGFAIKVVEVCVG
jgi:hypothetical protein